MRRDGAGPHADLIGTPPLSTEPLGSEPLGEDVTWIEGRDVIPIPMLYAKEFRADPRDSMLKFGCLPQRARAPWFTAVKPLEECMILPDQVCGPRSEVVADAKVRYRALVAAPDEMTLLDGLSPHFHCSDQSYWHFALDNALGKNREGDAAGIALGRISHSFEERSYDQLRRSYVRIVRSFEIPLVAQIIAPPGDQIYISSIVRLILQLKQLRGFNITSFSVDGFESAQAGQELMLAGLVTAGMYIDPFTGEIVGLPKPFSVDRTPQPYKDTLEVVNDVRVALPTYPLLLKECKELEFVEPGRAPDHPQGGSKDCADPVAQLIGYLSMFGHAEMQADETITVDREDLVRMYGIPDMPDFTGGEEFSLDDLQPINFDVS